LPEKWQGYLAAIQLFIVGSKNTEYAYEELIRKYGETREFANGMAEYLFHYNPIHGRSVLEAKPWLLKSRALDPNNMEALTHLSDIALTEDDTEALADIQESLDTTADHWIKARYRYLSTLDTITESQILEVAQHPNYGPGIFMAFEIALEDPIEYLEFSDMFIQHMDLWFQKFV